MTGWDFAKLGEICDFKGGSQPPKSNFIYEPRDGYIRFLQIRDFGSDKNHTYIPTSKKNNICREDDIMIGRYGASVGKILTGKTGAYNVALMKATPNTKIISREWLFHYLTSQTFQKSLMSVAARSAQDGFSKDDIYNFQVPLPPLPVQKAIVAKLDAAFASIEQAIGAAEQNAENAKQLFQSYLSDVFPLGGEGKNFAKLGEICDFKGGSQPPKSNFIYEPRDNYIRFLQIRDFGSDKNHTYIPTSKKNNICREDDIMIGRYGASVGKILTGKTGAYNVALMKATPNTKIISREWLFNYLTSELFQSNLRSVAARSAQDGFSKDDIYNFQVPVPPIFTQNEIVAKTDEIRFHTKKLAEIYSEKTSSFTALKQSLLQQAFSGRLVDA